MTLLTLLQSPTGSGITGSVTATLGTLTLAAQGVLPNVQPVEDARSKGGFDPYYFKRRNRRRTPEDVRHFADLVAQADMADAPEPIKAQAKDARAAALAALQTQARADMETALTEIRIFYALLREQTRMRRQDDEDEDDEILLLVA